MPESPHPVRLYVATFVALIVLLSLTIAAAFIDIGRHWNNAIGVGIPCIKATLIVLFFMHVKYQPWVTRLFAVAGFLWLGIMLTLTMSEYVTRNHPPGDSPKGEPVFVSSSPYPGPPPGRLGPEP
jgi:cytochrome c oxidase subunit 4